MRRNTESKSKGFGRNEKNDRLYEINREAALFFHNAFKVPGNPGYEYMKKRGIDDATLRKFGIGYADIQADSLLKHLNSKGYDNDILLKVGLISSREGKYNDKFRNRVMFPIINTRGKVIGFGGRALGDFSPKYLNSPESEIFLKKNNLYGLNLTRQDIGKEGSAILVEGYMDVISLYQSGVRNVAASLGTALTENQAALLKRYTDKVILSYDADEAGRNAALRGLEILHGAGINVRVLHVTDGKDPDEYVKKKGKEAFIELTKNALPYADYRIDNIKRHVDVSSTEGRITFLKEAIKVLKALTPSAADVYIRKIAQEMKISEGAIRMELYGNNSIENTNNATDKPNTDRLKTESTAQEDVQMSLLERTLIKLALIDSSYFDRILPYVYVFKSSFAHNIWNAIRTIYKETGDTADLQLLKDNLDEDDLRELDITRESVPVSDPERTFNECIATIELSELKKRESEIQIMLSIADESENEDTIRELMEELKEIQRAKNSYGGLQQ